MFGSKQKKIKSSKKTNEDLRDEIKTLKRTLNKLCKHERENYRTPTGIKDGQKGMIVCCDDCGRELPDELQLKAVIDQVGIQEEIKNIRFEENKLTLKRIALNRKLIRRA